MRQSEAVHAVTVTIVTVNPVDVAIVAIDIIATNAAVAMTTD